MVNRAETLSYARTRPPRVRSRVTRAKAREDAMGSAKNGLRRGGDWWSARRKADFGRAADAAAKGLAGGNWSATRRLGVRTGGLSRRSSRGQPSDLVAILVEADGGRRPGGAPRPRPCRADARPGEPGCPCSGPDGTCPGDGTPRTPRAGAAHGPRSGRRRGRATRFGC
jgi:hypothetical protein